jgi:peptidoglycan lytic transglycosylase G
MAMTLSTWFRRVIPFLLALVLTAVGIRTYLQSAPPANGLSPAVPTVVYIKPKTGVQDIALILREAGVIRSTWAFLALAYVQGSLKRLQSGEYEFHTGMTLLEILQKLEAGRVVTHQVTIPEGFTAEDIARLLATERLADAERFLALVQDQAVAARLHVPATRLEGYLFPDTYRLTRGMTEEEIIRIMVGRFLQAVPRDFEEQAARLKMETHEIVTLASLIEKETLLDTERPLVSAVFHNRLRLRMPLQSDPTAVYMVPRTQRRITASDLQRKTPYNTYLLPGLPPGPIANPGLVSIQAALNPAPVNFLYFVAKNDGSHQFSRTLEQHQQAVRLYQGGGRASPDQDNDAPTQVPSGKSPGRSRADGGRLLANRRAE